MIPEPTTVLWTWLRKAIDTTFPIWVDEDAARRLEVAWSAAADDLQRTVDDATAANALLPDAWLDARGIAYHLQLNRMLNSPSSGTAQLIQQMRELGVLCGNYADEIIRIKDQIYAELAANGIAFVASFGLPFPIGQWLRNNILAGAAARIAATVAAGAARIAAAAGRFARTLPGKVLNEMIEEPLITLGSHLLDVWRGARDSVNWRELPIASVSGGLGAGLSVPLRPIVRAVTTPVRVLTPPRFRNAVARSTEGFFTNGLTSPVSGTFVNAVAEGRNPFTEDYWKAIREQGLGAGMLATARVVSHDVGHWLREIVAPRPVDQVTHQVPVIEGGRDVLVPEGGGPGPGGGGPNNPPGGEVAAPDQQGGERLQVAGDQQVQDQQRLEERPAGDEQVGTRAPVGHATQAAATQVSPGAQVGAGTQVTPTAQTESAPVATVTNPQAPATPTQSNAVPANQAQAGPTQTAATPTPGTQAPASPAPGTQAPASPAQGVQGPANSSQSTNPAAQGAKEVRAQVQSEQSRQPAEQSGTKGPTDDPPGPPPDSPAEEFEDESEDREESATGVPAGPGLALAAPVAEVQHDPDQQTENPGNRPPPSHTTLTGEQNRAAPADEASPRGEQSPEGKPADPGKRVVSVELAQDDPAFEQRAVQGFFDALNERDASGQLTPAAEGLRQYYYTAPAGGRRAGLVNRKDERLGRRQFPVRTAAGDVAAVDVPIGRVRVGGDFMAKEVVEGTSTRTEVRLDDPSLGLGHREQAELQDEADLWRRGLGKLGRVVRRIGFSETDKLEPGPAPTPLRGSRAGERLGEVFAALVQRWLASTLFKGQQIQRATFAVNGGAGRFDQVYVRTDPATGTVTGFVIVEAKSVFGRLGARVGSDLRSYLQGHPEYVRSLLAGIRADPRRAAEAVTIPGVPGITTAGQLADALEQSLAEGNLSYLVVQAKVTFTPRRAKAGGIVIREFDLNLTKRNQDPAQERNDPGQQVTAPEHPGFEADGRAAAVPELTAAEALAAATLATESDFGGMIIGPPQRVGELIIVESRDHGRQVFRFVEGPVPSGRVAATDLSTGGSPHTTRISARIEGRNLTRAWVHEISHTLRALGTTGAHQHLQRASTQEVDDACLDAQRNEQRLLVRQLTEAKAVADRTGDPAARALEQQLRQDLEALTRSLERYGPTTGGPRSVHSYGGNVVTRPPGPLKVGESVIAELSEVNPGRTLFGNQGSAALGVPLDPTSFTALQARLVELIETGHRVTLAITELPGRTQRFTAARTAPDGSTTTHTAHDLNELAASLTAGPSAPAPLPNPAPQQTTAPRKGWISQFVSGWVVVSAAAWQAVLRSDVWTAAGIDQVEVDRTGGVRNNGIYAVTASTGARFRLVLRVGETAAENWSESTIMVGDRDTVVDVTLSDQLLPGDVAPVLARVLAETVAEIQRGHDPIQQPEGAKAFGPAAQPRSQVVQNIDDHADRVELRQRGTELQAVRWWQFLRAASLRAEGSKLLIAMGVAKGQKTAELLQVQLDKQERELARLMQPARSLKDERNSLRAYEAKALRGQGLASLVIGGTAIVLGQPLVGVAIIVPTLANAMVGGVMERWLDGRKEVGRQPAYDADRARRDEDHPGLRALLDEVISRRPVIKLPRATEWKNYGIRYAVPTLSAAAVAGALTLVGVPALSTAAVIATSALAKALTEKLVDAKKLDYRLARVDRSTRERLRDSESLDNRMVRSFTDLYFRLDRALTILAGHPDPGAWSPPADSAPVPDTRRDMPPFTLHAGVQSVDQVSAAARRVLLSKPEHTEAAEPGREPAGPGPARPGPADPDPTELAKHFSAEIELVISALGPILPAGVAGAFGEMVFLNLEERAGDLQKTHDATEREAAQGERTGAELLPWYELLDQRVRIVEAIAGIAPELGTRPGERAGFPAVPARPAGRRPIGTSHWLVFMIPIVAAGLGASGSVLVLDQLFDLPPLSVELTVAGALGAVIGAPFARRNFRLGELSRKQEVAAALAKQAADRNRVLEQRAIIRYLVAQLTIKAENYLNQTPHAPNNAASAATSRTDQVRAAVNQAVRDLAEEPGPKRNLYERLVALEHLLDTVEAIEHHEQHGTAESVAILQDELAERLRRINDLWRVNGQYGGFQVPQLAPGRSTIAQALNPRPTVYSEEIRGDGSAYLADGRAASEGSLTEDEILAAVDQTSEADFGGLIEGKPVRNGDVIVVRTPSGPQEFKVEIGRVRRGKIARTTLSTTGPHVVRFAPGIAGDQLARVWVHEISHALQAKDAPHGRFHRVLSRISAHVDDACVTAQLNEHQYLARSWTEATDAGRKQQLRLDLEALAEAIEHHGHPPPAPPWSGSPLIAEQQQLSDLRHHQKDKEAKAKEADQAARDARRRARANERKRDQGRFARIRADLAEAAKQEELARWYRQRAAAYRAAQDGQGLAALAPPEIALPSMQPTDDLPQLTRLTEQLNGELARQGIDEQLTPAGLQHRLSAEFGQLVTSDGAVIRVGKARTAELRIVLTVTELQEVLSPPAGSSEMMIGVMPQGGRRIATTATGRVGTTVGRSLREFTELVFDQLTTIGMLGRVLTARVESTFSRSLAVTGTAAEYAQEGNVEDNRGESLLYQGRGSWRVDIRTAASGRWSRVDAVSNESGVVRGWISHVYTVPAATELASNGVAPSGQLPEVMVTALSGLQALDDRIRAAFRGRLRALGAHEQSVQEQIQAAITQDLPGRLAESTGRPVIRPIQAGGNPIGYVEIRTTVRYEAVELVGPTSRTQWQERDRTGFSQVSGQEAFTGGVEHKGAGEAGASGVAELDASGAFPVGELGLGGTASRGEAQSAGGTAIQVGVQRYVGPTQGYKLVLDHEVTLVLDGHLPGTVHGTTEGLVRMRVHDAYHHGLPIDRAALALDDAGRQVVEGEVHPDTLRQERLDQLIPGRLLELPSWARPGQGAGPAMVQDVTGGNEAVASIMAHLADRGFLPPLNPDGTVDTDRLTTDPLERHGQLLNLEELVAQLSTQRLETGYDTAVQTGLLFTLTRPRTGMPTETVTFRLDLVQDGATRPVGVTEDQAMVTLNIGSDGANRVGSRSRAMPWWAKLAAKDPLEDDGSGAEAGASGGRTPLGRLMGFIVGGTVNQVTLVESTSPLAVFELSHRLVIAEVRHDAEIPVHEGRGTARVLLDSDLLPYSEDVFAGEVTAVGPNVLNRITILGLQVPDFLGGLPARLRRDPAALQQVAAFLNPRNLIAHPEWTGTTYRTGVIVSGRGPVSQRDTVAVRGQVRDAVMVGVTDGVSGDINFAMGSHGNFAGWSTATSGSLGRSETVDGQPGDPGTGLTAAGGRTRSAARTEQMIWGVERLAIEVGRHYVFAADADLQVTVGESAVQSETGKLHFQLAERDALRFYGRGELSLPLHQVADAVERYLTGDLQLDRVTATSLVRAYRRALAGTRSSPELSRGHNDHRLRARLLADAAADADRTKRGPWNRLRGLLDPAKDLLARRPRLTVPEQFRRGLGSSLIETVELADARSGSPVLDEVKAVLQEKLGISAEADAVLAEALFADLAGKRWWGRIDDMLAPDGFTRSYPVRRGAGLAPERVTIRIRATLDDEGIDLGESKSTVSIVQRYLYGERNVTTSNGRSLGVGAEGTLETGVTATGRTDRSETASVTIAEQQTRLERLATFAGVTRVQRGVKLSIEVGHDPSATPTGGRARRALQRTDGPDDRGGLVRTGTAELRGEFIQLIPSGFLGPRIEEPVGDPPTLPSAYFVDSVGHEDGQNLLAAVRAGVVKVLGESAARLHQAELESQLSASALNANFSMMATPEGHRIIRLESAGQGRDAVDIIIRAVPIDGVPVSPVVAGAELGEVNRSQHTVSSNVSSGRLLPAAGGTAMTAPGGVRTSVSFGEQLTNQTTDVRGVRRERTRFEDGSLVTVRLGVRYHIELAPVTVLGLVRTNVPERRGDPIELAPVPGVVYVTGHRYQLYPEREPE